MNVDVEPRQSRWSRLLLLAGGIGLAWCAITAFGQTSSASAAEEDPHGLLGVVSSTVQQTTSAVTDVIGTVEPIVAEVAHVVAPPAPAPAPAPHTPAVNLAPVVTPVVQSVAHVATTTVATVTDTATSALQGTADTVDVVTGVVADTTSGIVSDLSVAQLLAPLLTTIDDLPILGTVVGETGLTDTLGSAVSVLDQLVTSITGTATTIVGNPGQPGNGGILPLPDALVTGDATQLLPVLSSADSAAPLTVQQALFLGGLFAAARTVGSIAPIASASGPGTTRWGWPLAPAGSAGMPGLLSSTTAAAATLWAALVEFSWRAHPNGAAMRSLSDDALPGAPVFATDVSPD